VQGDVVVIEWKLVDFGTVKAKVAEQIKVGDSRNVVTEGEGTRRELEAPSNSTRVDDLI
jgi:hypothetical protein